MTPQPDIKRFIDTLFCLDRDYITMAELGVHPNIKARLLGRPMRTVSDEVDFWYQAGYDYVKLQPKVDFNPDKIGLSATQSVSDSGSLVYNWATEGQGIIQNEADLDSYRFPELDDIDLSIFDEAAGVLPAGMGIVGQYGDIFTLTWEMMGFEGFSMALFENPGLIDRLNQQIGERVLHMFRHMAASKSVDALWYSDDIAFSNALLMSPEVLHRYFFPWLKEIGALARAAGKPLIYHSDGILYDVLDDIIGCGVNALHPVEPKAMVLSEVKEKVQGRLCLVGAVDVDLLARGSKAEIEAKVYENIELFRGRSGYVAGSGNSIPDYVPFENYQSLIDSINKLRG